MGDSLKEFICLNLGIILNLVGTFLIAISFGSYPDKKTAPYTAENGKRKYIAYFNYPYFFWAGLALLFVGFMFQIKFAA